jgi:hypothetical protein
MKQNFTFKLMLLLCAIVLGSNAWATDGTLTLSSDKKFGTTSGSTLDDDQGNTWTCVGSNIQNTYNSSYGGQQFGTSKTNNTYTFTANFSNKTVTCVSITAAAGSSTPTYDISVGGVSKKSGSLSTSSTNYSTETISGTGNIVITLNQNSSKKAVYLGSITVTYTTGGGSSTTTTTIDATGITNNNVYTGTAAGSLSASVTYGSPATPVPLASVTWTSSNTGIATVSADGTVTLKAAGITTITASYEGNATYSASSDTYDLTVINENPDLETIWSENFSSYSADDVPTGGDYSYACEDGTSDTKIYDANLAGGAKPELLVGKSGGSFSATVPLLTSTYGYSGDLTLTFKSNAKSINVNTTTDDITVYEEESAGAGVTFTSLGTHTVTFKGTTVATENITIVFTANTSDNVRLDDIVLKGIQEELTTVATPVISPASGVVVAGREITITCLTEGASIYYTMGTDPADPTSSSTLYNPASKPTITSGCTVKAIGIKDGLTDSEVASATYTIAEPCATPTFSPAAGEVAKGTPVEISTTTPEATIYYTTDGTDPTTSSTVYSSAITINSAVTLKAIAAKEGNANSAVASAAYTVIDYATLPFIWAGGTSSALSAVTGVTTNGLGTDYAAANAPYYLKMDGVGDYIQIKTDSQPSIVTIGVKMIGGANTSKIKIQESTDGSEFTDVEELTISGAQNTVLNLTTNILFNAETRYVRIIKSVHGHNIGVGPISIYKNMPAPTVDGNNEIVSDVTINNGEYLIISSLIKIPSGRKITVSNKGVLVNTNPANLIIEDGGQLICSSPVAMTVEKNIGTSAKGNKWYTISTPVHTGDNAYVTPGNVTNLILMDGDDPEYDMFYYDEYNTTHSAPYWINHSSNLNIGQGYLYRNSNAKLSFQGTNNNEDAYTYNLKCTSEAGPLAGFNLIGNPYPHNIYKNDVYASSGVLPAINDDNLSVGYYKMNDEETWHSYIGYNNPIKPGEGILVKTSSATTLTISNNTNPAASYTPSKYGYDHIEFTVSNNRYEDVSYVMFNDGIGLDKISHRDENAPMIYIPQNGKDYAIATMKDNTETFGLSFKAMTTGKYTISAKALGNFSYIHLIDRLTGEDVDLLMEDYSFIGSPADSDARFIVKLTYTPSYSTEGNDNFAYQTGSEILVSGEGELQIFDVTGRKVMTTTINGVEAISGLPQGVYIFRVIGETQKTQKIVVK